MGARGWGGETLRLRVAALIAAVVVTGCGGPAIPTATPAGTPRPSPAATATPALTATPTAGAPSPVATAQASCAQRVLAGMPLDVRIGQLFMAGLADNRLGPAELRMIRSAHVGSVWFASRTGIGVAGLRAIADAVQVEATPAATAGVRFFIAANQEGGLIQALDGPGFSTIPSALEQGRESTAALAAGARRWGRQLRAAGVNLDFAPVSDVVPPGADATNQPIGVLHREYGHAPATTGSHVAAFIAGMTDAGVATTAKHFPGLGRVADNTDFSAGVVDDVTTAHDRYLASFKAAIGAGVPFVMVSLATYTHIDPGHLAVFSTAVMDDLLRGDLGFDGVVMSDSLTAAAVASIPAGQRAVDFLQAGGDLVVTNSTKATLAMVAAVRSRAEADSGFAARVDDAALRILEAKRSAGLLPCPG